MSLPARPPVGVDPDEVTFHAIRAQGPGGQHVNTSATAVQLRFDIGASSLPEPVKARLRAWPDDRIGADGVVVIKAQGSRSQAQNKAEALARLAELVAQAAHVPKVRRATRPTLASKRRRAADKARRSEVKSARRSPPD